ncbi:MAG: GAF domain-containing sensor histidine kinase [Deltaproteobacteria bacterium]|nr:GAF domain-containing sensor histidine kinase [Deltaproteobacteria bacterium]
MVSLPEPSGNDGDSELFDTDAFQDLKKNSLFLLKLRWWILTFILVCVTSMCLLGVEFKTGTILLVLVLMLALNISFSLKADKVRRADKDKVSFILMFLYFQFCMDYTLWFIIVYLTGGISSPFVIFFIFHIIFASVILTQTLACKLSAAACFGLALITFAGMMGWLPSFPFLGAKFAVDSISHPLYAISLWVIASSVFFLSVFLIPSMTDPLRKRSEDLVKLHASFEKGKNKFKNIVSMIEAIGSGKDFNKVLKTVTTELALGMGVMAISVKLLDETGRILRYRASYGLPEKFFKDKEIEVRKSLLNRRIIEGEPFVTGDITQREMFQFKEAMEEAEIKSVLFMPLTVDNKIIGILGAYCKKRDRFDERSIDFFKLASGIVAIALENARSYEAIKRLIADRSWFMMKVAYNLRAPLREVASMIGALSEKLLGVINPDQEEYIRLVDRKTMAMFSTVNALMTLYEIRTERSKFEKVAFDVYLIAGRIEMAFLDEAREKEIEFKIVVSAELTNIWGNIDLIEQLFKNLVSNAIRYTLSKGKVLVRFEKDQKHIMKAMVQDSGIGVPADDLPRVFSEFFRAHNARDLEENGTGLGLAIVKEIVEIHGGTINIISELGRGTTVTVLLPLPNRKECGA